MNFRDKKFVLILSLLVVSGVVSWSLYFKSYAKADTVDIHKFPKAIKEWTSEEMPITDDEYAILETKNAFIRKYTNPSGAQVYLFIVYSESNRKVAHPPEICYTGGGVSITGSTHDIIKIDSPKMEIKANRLNLEMGRDRQLSYYWFKVGDTFTSNYWKQQGLIAVKSLLGQSSSSALIRVSSVVAKEDEVQAAENVKEFTRLIMPDLLKYLP